MACRQAGLLALSAVVYTEYNEVKGICSTQQSNDTPKR